MIYDIHWHGDHYELWVDGKHVNDYRTFIEALNEADRLGATRRPKKEYNDEGAPF